MYIFKKKKKTYQHAVTQHCVDLNGESKNKHGGVYACLCVCLHMLMCVLRGCWAIIKRRRKLESVLELKVDNMSAAWKPLGGERKIKKGIQA